MTGGRTFQEAHLIASIHELFSSDEGLLEFFFHHKRFDLRLPREELLKEAESLGPFKWILMRVALDFWDGSGRATVNELLRILDEETLVSVMRAILKFREISEC